MLAVAGLLAAACGGTDDGREDDASSVVEDGAEGAVDDSDQSSAAETAEGSGSVEADPGSDESSASVGESEPEIVFTDSFRGVTAETISLGVSTIDFDTLNETFGLDLAFQDFAPMFDAAASWFNERGGVLGREIELIHTHFLPVGAQTAEISCIELTEDHEVFAVLVGFTGPGAEGVNECITLLHDTVLVGSPPQPHQAEEAGGLWVSWEMRLDRRNEAFVDLLDQAGALSDLGSVMVVGANPEEEGLVEAMADAFEDRGVSVPQRLWTTTTGDTLATNAEVDVFIELARADDVSTVALLGEGEIRNRRFFERAPELTYLVTNGDRITDWASIPPQGLQEGTRVLASNTEVRLGTDPALDECVAAIEERMGIEIIPTADLPAGDPNYWSGSLNACRFLSMFIQIAEAAGPDLTNDSWVGALDQVPDISIPGFQFASLSATKTDARDQLVLVEYDLEGRAFVPRSDAIDIG